MSLNLAPGWSRLEVRGHLIQHPALPGPEEPVEARLTDVLPRYDGPRCNLALTRHPPAQFVVTG